MIFHKVAGQINQKITINSHENSQVFSLTVEDSNAARAVKIANSVSETFQKEIPGIMNVDNVSILAKAEFKENPTPVKPRPIIEYCHCICGRLDGWNWIGISIRVHG